MAIINFGSINIDHVYQVPHFVTPGETLASTDYQKLLGGKGANQSIAIAKAGAEVKHVGLINEIDCGIKQTLIRAGIDCQFVKMSEQATGHAIIQVNTSGENAIVLYAGANHDLSDKLISHAIGSAESGDWMLTQNETNGIADAMQQAKNMGMKIAFNPAPMTESVKSLPLDLVDLLIVNEVEAADLSGKQEMSEIEAFFKEEFANTEVIITLGKAGVKMLNSGEDLFVPAFTVNAVDTTAAGDTFIGYFLSSYTNGVDAASALKRGCAASALAVMKQGAAQSIPDPKAVDQFLAQHN